jgi:aspartate racemase
MKKKPLIGIVGGIGPAAGFDCAEKIIDQTIAEKDQDHIPLVVLSCPHLIGDRTAFLANRERKNPAYTMVEMIKQLHQIGSEVIGIPCNTAHAPIIFSVIIQELKKQCISVKLINMIDETIAFLTSHFPRTETVGLLATQGTYEAEIYTQPLIEKGYTVVIPDKRGRQNIHQAIYDKKRGIKAQSKPVTIWAADIISVSIHYLFSQGADCIIMGCTEIPLALPLVTPDSVSLIDPTLILARVLIRETYPEKLKNFTV